jgi:hypothetical protein
MLGTDQYGMVDSLFRTVWLTARSCARRFGEDKLSHAVKEAAKNSPNQWIEVRHAVQPNNQRDGNAFDNQNMPFESAYWVKGEDQLLRKSGYHEFPAPSPRWGQTPGVYGWSPGMDVLSSQKILHEMDIGVLDAQQKELDPPVIRPPGFKHLTAYWAGRAERDRSEVCRQRQAAVRLPVRLPRDPAAHGPQGAAGAAYPLL